ncbi:hypothetical protein LJC35_05290 [Parabacteroides sp. OttesenSCG-928-N08]|nr:hypothetical protein [Parabacteroides sp. OttesenSCG-928-N08]
MKTTTKRIQSVMMGAAMLAMVACSGGSKTNKSDGCCEEKAACCEETTDCGNCNKHSKEMKYQKKYTNADFYTDGKFNEKVAIEAFKDMLNFYGVPFTPLMEKDFWVVDFGLGDFENLGMGGIFWVNDAEHNYFAHTIYLLPSQMIPEHAHVKTEYAPKFESWMVTKGWCYNFAEIGDETPNAPAIPALHGAIKSKNFVKQNVGEVVHLKKEESFHFLLAGPEGAIVDEWASYHDGAGLRFTNQKAKL